MAVDAPSGRAGARAHTAEWWLAAIAGLVLLGPAAVFVQAARNELHYGEPLAIVSALLFVLVIARIPLAIRELTRLRAEAYYRGVFSNAFDAYLVVDEEGAIHDDGAGALRMLNAESLKGRRFTEFLHPDRAPIVIDALHRARSSAVLPGRGEPDWPMRLALNPVSADGGERIVEVGCAPLPVPVSGVSCVLTLHDVTEQLRLDGALRYLALHDPATGLPNALQLRQSLNAALEVVGAPDDAVGVLLVTLSGAVALSQTTGSGAWDAAIRAAARRLGATLGDPLIARVADNQLGLTFGPVRDAARLRDLAGQAAGRPRPPGQVHARSPPAPTDGRGFAAEPPRPAPRRCCACPCRPL